MKLRFFKLVDNKLSLANKTTLLTIDNPGAIHTINSKMVIHPDNKTFSKEELETVVQLISKIK